MRHRIGIGARTGLGNPSKELLSGKGELALAAKDMAKEAIRLYFKKWGGCDYEAGGDEVKLGVEPAYQFEDLKIICIRRDKGKSYLRTGRAFGMYGSGIRSRYKFYSDCKRKAKFKRFVDRWHPKVFQLKKGGWGIEDPYILF